jgi:OOP family OmpA-OmpF porin
MLEAAPGTGRRVMARRWIASLLAAGVVLAASAPADADYEGCQDVFVTRLAGFHIQECLDRKFDAYTFAGGTPKQSRVEGHVVDTYYRYDAGREAPSARTVRNSYEDVFRDAGWIVFYADADTLTETQVKAGEEHWVQLMSNAGDFYELVAVQKEKAEQRVGSSDWMLKALNESGRVPLQIDFDAAKATIRPESQPIVLQVVALLEDNPLLSLSIEDYTDNRGSAKSSKSLSEARARAVVAVLVANGIAPRRLKAAGFGQERPVADNATEAGRAKNRRVELVKQ